MHVSSEYAITDTPDENEWSRFVHTHHRGNIFQSPEFFRFERTIDVYHPTVLAAVHVSGILSGILVYTAIRDNGVKGFFSTRAIIRGGPLIGAGHEACLVALVNEYVDRINKQHIIYTQVRDVFADNPLTAHLQAAGFRAYAHLTYTVNLAESSCELWLKMHKMRRSNIQRAIKKGVTVNTAGNNDLSAVHDLIKQTYKRVNTPGPPAGLFWAANKYLGEHAKILVAKKDGASIGCRVYLMYKNMVYDWYAGSNLEYSGLHPNDVLPWEAMKFFKVQGYELYDFGGAGTPSVPYGVREYKKRFGGKLVETRRYLMVHKPVLFFLGKIALAVLKYLRSL
jgi:serine/alanine adding enzyme